MRPARWRRRERGRRRRGVRVERIESIAVRLETRDGPAGMPSHRALHPPFVAQRKRDDVRSGGVRGHKRRGDDRAVRPEDAAHAQPRGAARGAVDVTRPASLARVPKTEKRVGGRRGDRMGMGRGPRRDGRGGKRGRLGGTGAPSRERGGRRRGARGVGDERAVGGGVSRGDCGFGDDGRIGLIGGPVCGDRRYGRRHGRRGRLGGRRSRRRGRRGVYVLDG